MAYPESRSKIPPQTESYLGSLVLPKFVLVKLDDSQGEFEKNFASLRTAFEERIKTEEPEMTYESFASSFNIISLTSSSADFIRSLAERSDVRFIQNGHEEVRLPKVWPD